MSKKLYLIAQSELLNNSTILTDTITIVEANSERIAYTIFAEKVIMTDDELKKFFCTSKVGFAYIDRFLSMNYSEENLEEKFENNVKSFFVNYPEFAQIYIDSYLESRDDELMSFPVEMLGVMCQLDEMYFIKNVSEVYFK